MSEDKLSWVDEPIDAPEPIEALEPAIEEAAPEVPRDEHGRFAPRDGKGEIESAPPAPEQPKEQHTAPLTALLDERERRQVAEREREDLRRQIAELTRKPQAEPEMPDVVVDPEGYRRVLAAENERAVLATKVQMSKFMAEREFGPELVAEAMAYYDANPQGTQAFLREPSPFHVAVEAYRRQKAFSEIGPDPEAYRQKLRQEWEAERAQAAPPPRPSAPPPSLASAPSTGVQTGVMRGSAFDQAFPK